jgi:hypothetical protein
MCFAMVTLWNTLSQGKFSVTGESQFPLQSGRTGVSGPALVKLSEVAQQSGVAPDVVKLRSSVNTG